MNDSYKYPKASNYIYISHLYIKNNNIYIPLTAVFPCCDITKSICVVDGYRRIGCVDDNYKKLITANDPRIEVVYECIDYDIGGYTHIHAGSYVIEDESGAKLDIDGIVAKAKQKFEDTCGGDVIDKIKELIKDTSCVWGRHQL